MEMMVGRVDDFEINGRGDAPQWDGAQWHGLTRLEEGGSDYPTRAKVLYSSKGIYFLMECEDRKLSCSRRPDFEDIWEEDVVEVFLWPDESVPLYFEYELSPLEVELPILVPNRMGTPFGWLPWHYEGERKVRRATSIVGGAKEPKAAVRSWTAEFMIPFDLFRGIVPVPPGPGSRWRANLYRVDHDHAPSSHWAWCPRTGTEFHEYKNFGTMVFGG